MPQIYYQPLQGAFLSPHRAFDSNESLYEHSRSKERHKLANSSVSQPYIKQELDKTLDQVWAHSVGNGQEDGLFNESYPQVSATFDNANDLGFLQGNCLVQDVPIAQHVLIDPSINMQCHSAHTVPHTVPQGRHETDLFFKPSEIRVDDEFDLFMKETPYLDIDEADEYFSDALNGECTEFECYQGQQIKPKREKLKEPRGPRGLRGPKPNLLLSSPVSNHHTISPKKHNLSSPRKLRKAKSFGSGVTKFISSNNFSLGQCLNEFHFQEGKILFQDETARVVKHSGNPFMSRRKSAPKLSSISQPTRKSKPAEVRGECFETMDSGLISFQLDFGPKDSPITKHSRDNSGDKSPSRARNWNEW